MLGGFGGCGDLGLDEGDRLGSARVERLREPVARLGEACTRTARTQLGVSGPFGCGIAMGLCRRLLLGLLLGLLLRCGRKCRQETGNLGIAALGGVLVTQGGAGG